MGTAFLQRQNRCSKCQPVPSARDKAAALLDMETPLLHNHHSFSNGAEPVDIWKARNFIDQHYADDLSLPGVARVANISAGHLSEKFKHVTGTKFVDYVAQVRFDKACERLTAENARVSEIAFEVGFQSLSQFNRVFKRLSGKSPTEYRAALLRHRAK